MTDILNVVVNTKYTRAILQSNFISIEHVFSLSHIPYIRTTNSAIQFLLPFSLLKPSQQLAVFYDYFFAGTCKVYNGVLSCRLVIHNASGIQIKANSLQQKTFLTKYLMNVNGNCQYYQVKSNPITGELSLQQSFWISEQTDLSESVYCILNNFRNNPQIIFKVLKCIEQPSCYKFSSSPYHHIGQKLQVVRCLIKNSSNYQVGSHTKNQIQHQNYFFAQQSPQISLNKSANLNNIQKMKKTYVQSFINQFIQSNNGHGSSNGGNAKNKKNNFGYVMVADSPSLQLLLKNIQVDNLQPLGSVFQLKIQIEQTQHTLELKSLQTKQINKNYSLLDKLSKKKLYLPFIKQYLIARNHLSISNHYLISKKQARRTTSLHKYLLINKFSLSLETRLKIVAQILAIAIISFDKLQSSLMLSLTNIRIDQSFNLIIDCLDSAQADARKYLLSTLYKIMFNREYYTKGEEKQIKNNFISMQDSQLKYYGPSVLMKWVLKMFENLDLQIQQSNKILNQMNEKNENASTGVDSKALSSKMLQNFLLLINRSSDAYQDVLADVWGHEEQENSWMW